MNRIIVSIVILALMAVGCFISVGVVDNLRTVTAANV